MGKIQSKIAIEGNIVADYMSGNMHIVISDAAYAGKTEKELGAVYNDLMKAAWRIADEARMAGQDI